MFENLLGGGAKKQNAPATANKPAIQPMAPIAPAAAANAPQMQMTGGATTAGGKDISVEVEDLRKDVDKLKDSVNAIRGTLKSLTEKMDSIENNLAQLASVYELLTNQMNPFLDEDEKKVVQPKPKKVEQPVPAVPQLAPAEEKQEDVVLPELDLTNPKVIQTILDWMQFVVERVGHEGVQDVLQYYVDVKWISEEVAEVLQRYADGIKVEVEPEIEKPVQLDPEDHMKSLDYIMQIKEFQEKG